MGEQVSRFATWWPICWIMGHDWHSARPIAWCGKGYEHRCLRCNKLLWVQDYDGGGWP